MEYIHIYMYIYVYIYIYLHTHTHIYIHTHIHICMFTCLFSNPPSPCRKQTVKTGLSSGLASFCILSFYKVHDMVEAGQLFLIYTNITINDE